MVVYYVDMSQKQCCEKWGIFLIMRTFRGSLGEKVMGNSLFVSWGIFINAGLKVYISLDDENQPLKHNFKGNF